MEGDGARKLYRVHLKHVQRKKDDQALQSTPLTSRPSFVVMQDTIKSMETKQMQSTTRKQIIDGKGTRHTEQEGSETSAGKKGETKKKKSFLKQNSRMLSGDMKMIAPDQGALKMKTSSSSSDRIRISKLGCTMNDNVGNDMECGESTKQKRKKKNAVKKRTKRLIEPRCRPKSKVQP